VLGEELVTVMPAVEPELPPLAIAIGTPPWPNSTAPGNVLGDELETVAPAVEPAPSNVTN
jgi:hypothetical protein